MRPIDRGASPQVFTDYQQAKPFLTNRLGTYCNFCERRIPTNLAVEHILPKDENLPYSHLRNEWTNFLLSCVNCNSTKGIQIIDFSEYLLPDRDNTFLFYNYLENGSVEAIGIDVNIKQMAQNTLNLVGLNRLEHPNWEVAVMFSALQRAGQRVQAWIQAKEAREDYENGEVNIRRIASEAASTGFFSIWMKAFEGLIEVRRALIAVFSNTAPDCFNDDTDSVTPRPDNGLQNAGKA